MSIQLKGSDDSTFSNDIAPAAGKGIDFSANKSSNTVTSNTLIAYEEGTFTPEVIWRNGADGSESPAVASNSAVNYIRIGNRLFANFNTNNITVAPNTTDNVTCGLGIKNLPYSAPSKYSPSGSIYFGGVLAGRPYIAAVQMVGVANITGIGCISNTDGTAIAGTSLFNALTANGNTSLIVTLSFEVAI